MKRDRESFFMDAGCRIHFDYIPGLKALLTGDSIEGDLEQDETAASR